MSKAPSAAAWLDLARELTAAHEALAISHPQGTLDTRFRKLLEKHFPRIHLTVILPDVKAGNARFALATGPLKKLEARVFNLKRISGQFGKMKPGSKPVIFTKFKKLEPYRPISKGARAVAVFPVSARSQEAGYLWVEFLGTDYKNRTTLEFLQHTVAQYTALRRLEEIDLERKHLAARLNSIVTHTNAAIVIMDDNRRVKMMNPVAEMLTGYRESEVLDTDAFDIVVVDARYAHWTQIIKDVAKGKGVSSEEVDILAKDGTVRHCLVNASSIPAADHRRRDIVMVAMDITEKTDLERRMIQSEKLVTLGEMAAGIVHELNNPLSVLSGASDMLIRFTENIGGGSELATRPARFMRESLDRIQSLARNLMNYARPADGDDRELIDINQAIEAALSFSEYELSRDGVKIETQLKSGLPRIRGSQGELQQVFLNLLQNARQAMRGQEGAKRIRVTTGHEDDGRIFIDVSDSGPGIPESLRPKIFEPFFTSRRKTGGSGLGLYIVKNIVTRHDGEVTAGKGPLGGAAFRVILPAASRAV